MSYVIIKGTNQLSIEGKEIDDKIYLPLESLWEDYSILKDEKVVFLDSPLFGIKIGVMDTSRQKSDVIRHLIKLLKGAGCIVNEVNKNYIPTDTNLVLELNNDEGIYKTGYEGFNLNGSRRLAADIGWSIIRIFQLDYIVPPKKLKGNKEISLWHKLTVPWVTISWRSFKDNEILLPIAILLGLFKFASGKIPTIDESIFVKKNYREKENPIVEKKEIQVLTRKVKEEIIMDDNTNNKGKLVKNPSPKLQAYMKKILAKQQIKDKKQEKSYPFHPQDIYKKSSKG